MGYNNHFRVIQSAFTGGEISPILENRVDNDVVGNGLSRCRNMFPLKEGAVTKRPGTRFSKSFPYGGRLIPYRYSSEQDYLLYLSEEKIEFIKDGEFITENIPLDGVLNTDDFAVNNSSGTQGTSFSMNGWLGTPYTVSSSSIASSFPRWSSGNGGQFLAGGLTIERVTRTTKPFTLVEGYVYKLSAGLSNSSSAAKFEITDSSPANAGLTNQTNLTNSGTTIVSHGISQTTSTNSVQPYWFDNQSADLSRFVSWRTYGGSAPNLTSFTLEHVGFSVHRNLFQTDLSGWVNTNITGQPLGSVVYNSQITTPNHNEAAYAMFQTSNNIAGLEVAGITKQIAFPYAGQHTIVVAVTQEATMHLRIAELRFKLGTTAGAGNVLNPATDILAGVAASARWQNTHTSGIVTYIPFTFDVVTPGDYFVTLEMVDTLNATPTGIARLRLAEVVIFANVLNQLYSVAVPYQEEELCDVGYSSAERMLFFTHQKYEPFVLRRKETVDEWEVVGVDYLDGPYLEQNTDPAFTITPSAATGVVTLTASANLFNANDVGRWVRLFHAGQWGAAKISTYSSATSVQAVVSAFFPFGDLTTPATSAWRIGAFGGEQGFPARSAFYDSRLFWGRTKGQPGTVFASVVNGIANQLAPGETWATVVMSPTTTGGAVTDDRAFTRELPQTRIHDLVSGPTLGIMGNNGEFELLAGDTSNALAPTNVMLRTLTKRGMDECLRAIRLDSSTLFVERASRAVRELTFEQGRNGFVSPELSLLAQHLVRESPIKQIVYSQNPLNMLWAVREDGRLLSLTYDTNQNLFGWALHTLGGSFQGGIPQVVSVGSVYNESAGYDELTLVVQRTLNGEDVWSVEVMANVFIDPNIPLEDAHFVDCGIIYDGAATATISTDHLAGQSVAVVANGVVQPTVTAGETVTVPSGTTSAHVGFAYDSYVETLEMDVPSQKGSALLLKKDVYDVKAKVYRSGVCEVGYRDVLTDNLSTARHNINPTWQVAQSLPLFTGVLDNLTIMHPSHQPKTAVVIRSQTPTPLTITMFAAKIKVIEES